MIHQERKKFLEVQQTLGLRGVSYVCPLCSQDYTQEPVLWRHLRDRHEAHLGLTESQEGETEIRELWKDKAKQKAQEKPPSPNYTAVERAGDHGSQRSLKAPTTSERDSIAAETSEGTLPGGPVAAQPSIGHSTALSTENPLKREGPSGPGSFSPERNLRAAQSPRSGSRTRTDSGVHKTLLIHKAADDHKAEAYFSGLVPQGLDLLSPQRGILHISKASQYESPKEVQPSCTPADLGASTGHLQPMLEPNSGKVTRASQRRSRGPGKLPPPHEQDEPEGDTSMLRQPETRPISHDQLVVEVKGIYAGLVMVEAKCMEVDERQKLWAQDREYASQNPVTADQWKSLIALHKQLLHEHHDFFLASQHPSASNNLSRLAAKYIMPARMWRHGIHGFLEVLRHRLPGSLEHMLAFIYIAYNMMALLFETVPSFEDTWIECLGDLGRYRMAIEDDEPRDREIWSNVARYWYSKASDKSPITGRLYHHLAILARPNTLEHMSLYTKSLTCIVPFEAAKGSILTLLNPVLSGKVSVSPRNLQIEVLFIKAHAILFTYRINDFSEVRQLSQSNVVNDFLYRKDEKGRGDDIWRVRRILAYLATANVSGILEYGATLENGTPRSPIRREHDAMNVRKGEEFSRGREEAPGDTFLQKSHDTINIFELTTRMEYPSAFPTPEEQDRSSTIVPYASRLAFTTMKYLISDLHWGPEAQVWKHVLPFNHIMMVFIWSCCEAGTSITMIEPFIPWGGLCVYLNELAVKGGGMEGFVNSPAPFREHGADDGRPLWEDFLLRGLTYTLWYFPENWFSKSGLDDEERQLELPSMDDVRIARILGLGFRIASYGKWITFDNETKRFEPCHSVTEPAHAEFRMKLPHNWGKSDEDSIMSDVSLTEGGLANANVTPSDVSNVSSTSSLPTTLNDPLDMNLVNGEATENAFTPKATPKAIAADEPGDIPMIDLSPTKEVPPPMEEKPLALEQVPSNNALDLVTSKTQELSDIRQMADDSKIE